METLETAAAAAAAVVSIAVGAGVAAVAVVVGTTVITDQLAYHGDTPELKWTVMMSCPIWTTPRDPGRGYYNGRIEINTMTRYLRAFDDERFPPSYFPVPPPVLDIALHGDGVHIKFNPVRSTNNNFRMTKMTVSYTGGDHFTFLVSTEVGNILMDVMRAW